MLRWRWWERVGKSEAGSYARWIHQRFEARRPQFQAAAQPGLFSLLTVVQEPNLADFDELCWSVGAQDYPHFEWVLVDQTRSSALKARLKEAAKDARVVLLRGDGNRGLAAGYRFAVDAATQRYLLPLAAEDRLYPDALRVVAAFLQQHGYPAFIYTDEDQLPPDGQPTEPFCKPDWDPLLLYAGDYTARLAVLDRLLAQKAGAFTDEGLGRLVVWDACCRFVALGQEPAHLPEILYSRRVPKPRLALATEPDESAAALQVARHHLRRQRLAERLNVRANPLPGRAGLWRLSWQANATDQGIQKLVPGHTLNELRWKLDRLTDDSLAVVHSPGLQFLTDDWADEVRVLFTALPDVVAATGCVLNENDQILSAGEYFGLDGLLASPYWSRRPGDPLGQGRLFCQQTVGAPSPHFFVIEVGFLKGLLESQGREMALSLLHAWIGAEARAQGFRVVYSPQLLVQMRTGGAAIRPSVEEIFRFLRCHWPLLLDDPAWSRFHGLDTDRPFAIATPGERAAVLERTLCCLAGVVPYEETLRAAAKEYPSRMQMPLVRPRHRRAA